MTASSILRVGSLSAAASFSAWLPTRLFVINVGSFLEIQQARSRAAAVIGQSFEDGGAGLTRIVWVDSCGLLSEQGCQFGHLLSFELPGLSLDIGGIVDAFPEQTPLNSRAEKSAEERFNALKQ
jgi:hypothetical protein